MTIVTVILFVRKVASTFLFLQLTGDRSSDNMATVMNKRKVLSVEEKVKVTRQIYNWGGEKKKADVCRDFGLVNFTIQTIWENRNRVDIVRTVYHLVIYMQSNKIHKVF